MRVILLGLSLFLSGCALFDDISPTNRHSYWLASMRNEVGRSIFNCDTHRRCRQNLFHSEITLENGNKEAAFFMPHRKELRCRYYFEYEAASGKIDVLITDFDLPHLNGLELAEAVGRLFPDLPIILVTGAIQLEGGLKFDEQRKLFDVVLTKPVEKAQLIDAVLNALPRSKKRTP